LIVTFVLAPDCCALAVDCCALGAVLCVFAFLLLPPHPLALSETTANAATAVNDRVPITCSSLRRMRAA
jgi:hypothetical protein